MEYTISEERLTKLIMKIIKSMEIEGLYRVKINFPKKSTEHIVVALFFDIVGDGFFFKEIDNDVTNRLKDLLGIDPFVVPIPYTEGKYHLREPRNI